MSSPRLGSIVLRAVFRLCFHLLTDFHKHLGFWNFPNYAKIQSVTQMLQMTKILRVVLPCLLVSSYRRFRDFILRAINPGQLVCAWKIYQ